MNKHLTRRGLRLSTIEAVGAVIFTAFTTGPFLTGFALHLKASDNMLGVLAAIPAIAQVCQFGGAWVTQQTGRRKRVAAYGALVGRVLYLPIAVLLFCDFPARNTLLAFLILFALSNSLMQFAGVAWMSWMSDLVPPRIQGRYYGRRNLWLGLVTILATYAAGRYMDHAKLGGWELAGYRNLYLAAAACGFYCLLMLLRQPEPPYHPEPMPGWHFIVLPFRNPAFRKLMIFNVYWLFSVNIAAPFFTPHLMKYMHWSYSQLALLGIIFTVAAGFAHYLWGGVLDRWGKRPVLILTSLGIFALPHTYLWCRYDWTLPIQLNAVTGGILWSGWGLAMFVLMQQLVPANGRPAFFAMWAAISGLANFFAGIAGGKIAHALGGMTLEWRGLHLNHYQMVFLLSILVRIPGLFLLLGIHDPSAQPLGRLVRGAFDWMSRQTRSFTSTYGYLGGRLRQDNRANPPDEGAGGF
ncbi:MAG: MFS transporter [Kiritimatiellia bacterium]